MKIYYGKSETKFKTRFPNRKKSFNHKKHKNDTQLSNEIWNIKASKEAVKFPGIIEIF